jgi:hypothetical protein
VQNIRITKPRKVIGNDILVFWDKIDFCDDRGINGKINSIKQDRVVNMLHMQGREHVDHFCAVRVNSNLVTCVFSTQAEC